MKPFLALLVAALLGVAGWAAFESTEQHAPGGLATLMPQNAVLFLEAKDFGNVLHQWSASPEKQAWLKSDNYEAFSRSRLFVRLQQAQQEFASAAGVPPDSSFLSDVAGDRSALAIYDIGKLELLYITRLPSSKASNTGLWQQRGNFETRESAGRKFYVRTDAQSERVVAFAVEDGYLILGTREDLVAGALSLLSGQKAVALSQQSWFVDALKAASREPGDLRMVIHLAEVAKTPQFRTYWVQQNITETRRYESSVSDLMLSASTYREERSLLLKNASESNAADEKRVAELMRLVPSEIGFYRAAAAPTLEDSVALIEQNVLMPRLSPAPESNLAPPAASGAQNVGSAASLDVRIDLPPANITESSGDEALRSSLITGDVRADLQLHRTESSSDGVFVHLYATIVLVGSTDWNEAAIKHALQQILAPGLTASNLGIAWKSSGSGTQSYSELDGLSRVAIAVKGKYLFISNDPQTLVSVLGRLSNPVSATPALYCAGFDHSRERQNFYLLTSVIDQPSRSGVHYGSENEPEFFSQNVASFSQSFASLKSQSITATRDGARENQTVVYEWAQ